MAVNLETLGAGGPAAPARPLVVSAARTSRRIRLDQWASRLVVVGGLVIIAAILAILFVIVAEVYPLFKVPTATLVRSYPATDPAAAWRLAGSEGLGVDEYRAIAYGIDRRGLLQLLSLKDGRALPPVPIVGLDGAQVSAIGYGGHSRYAIGTSDGRVIPLEMNFEAAFLGGERTVTPRPVFGEPSALDPERKRPIRTLTSAVPGSGPISIAQVGPTELVIHATVEKKALIGPSTRRGVAADAQPGDRRRGHEARAGRTRRGSVHRDLPGSGGSL